MPISFDPNPATVQGREEMHEIAVEHMRPWSREYDDREHEMPWEYVNPMWNGPPAGAARATADRATAW